MSNFNALPLIMAAGLVTYNFMPGTQQHGHGIGGIESITTTVVETEVPIEMGENNSSTDTLGSIVDESEGIIAEAFTDKMYPDETTTATADEAGPMAFRLVNKHTGKALEVTGGDVREGAAVGQWDVDGSDEQAWIVSGDRFINAFTCKYLSTATQSGEYTPGTRVVQSAIADEHARWSVDAQSGKIMHAESGMQLEIPAGDISNGQIAWLWTRDDDAWSSFDFVPIDSRWVDVCKTTSIHRDAEDEVAIIEHHSMHINTGHSNITWSEVDVSMVAEELGENNIVQFRQTTSA